MLDRRAFLQNVGVGVAAFGLGLGLGRSHLHDIPATRTVLHAFLPAREEAIADAVRAFLAAAPAALPVPALDVSPRWRAAVATGLGDRVADMRRGDPRALNLQIADLAQPIPADLLVQIGGRVLDPGSQFSADLLALRRRYHAQEATLVFTACLDVRDDPRGADRVLVVETERGLQDRIVLTGAPRQLVLHGPAGRTVVAFAADGARVTETCCRHRTCQLQGTVRAAGDLIACAPNRIILRVESASA